jgi:hypothetical protein
MSERVWNPKPPTETVAFVDDWTDELGSDTIASYTFARTSGDATISKDDRVGSLLTYLIAGGTAGTTSAFLTTVTTGSGQVLTRTFSLLVATGADSYRPTSTTKRKLVEMMFAECRLLGWELDITAEEKDLALTRLDALMWELRGRGYELGYNFPSAIGAGALTDNLGCPDQAFSGLAILGAERLASTMGKTQSKETRIALSAAMKAVIAAVDNLVPLSAFAPDTPLGAGNRTTLGLRFA